MKFKRILSVICISLVLGFVVKAQTASTASGGEATGSGGTVSYTLGQVAHSNNTGSNGSVSEGVQQPFEISVVTGMEQAEGISLSISAYPNPTTDFLTLKVNAFDLSNLSFQLYDINGKLLQTAKVNGRETQISMQKYVSALYFVKVLSKNQIIKNFRVAKK